jgi:uncharacterized membrane protein YedE/YeeE
VTAVTAFVAGAVFAVGLALSGMTDPGKVLGFLDVAGAWDPTLVFVMAGAVGVYTPLYALITRRRRRPLLAPAFALPAGRAIDRRLLGGAALFGVGWGLSGYCPGPALTSLGAAAAPAAVFAAAMVAGMAAWRLAGAAARGRPTSSAALIASDDA